MPVSDRLVLLTRAVAVFAVNAVLGLIASAATLGTHVSADTAQLTVAWLLPMTAACALALAVAVAIRSAIAGAGAGVGAWIILVLAHGAADGPAGQAAASPPRRCPPSSPTRTCTSPTWRSRPAAPRS